jgi:hypothetical protein
VEGHVPNAGLVVDDSGRLWVRRFAESMEEPTFDVFDRDGNHLTSLRLGIRTPAFFHPRIRGDRLYTLARDEMEVPYVVRLEVPIPEP